MDKVSLILDGKTVYLQKWPLRPGWKLGNRITMLGEQIVQMLPDSNIDLATIDFKKIAGFISDDNLQLLIDCLVNGIEGASPELIDQLSFEAALTAFEAVLRHNLSFLMARLQTLRPSSVTSTPPAQS